MGKLEDIECGYEIFKSLSEKPPSLFSTTAIAYWQTVGYLLGLLKEYRIEINKLKEEVRVLECYDIRRLRKENGHEPG